jgi:NADH:ubiquinone oxidoreductase subunit F (NADH-binding)
MGGAGIPAAQKWRDVQDAVRRARLRDEDDRAFIVVNGDESEPGTFKDRELLLRTPHLVVEGVILAGLLTEATQGFIYIRHEYGEQIEACRREIERAEQLGFCGPSASQLGRPFHVSVFVSPGGYICGEQSALIEAMSDRRGEPRNMPPKLETNGLDDLPTLVSNVETFAWTPFIQVHGGKTYASRGVNGCQGLRISTRCPWASPSASWSWTKNTARACGTTSRSRALRPQAPPAVSSRQNCGPVPDSRASTPQTRLGLNWPSAADSTPAPKSWTSWTSNSN